jgi:hypothetical protein
MADKLIYDAKEPLLIAGNRALSEPFLNQFYGTLSVLQVQRFEKLYRELKTEVEIIGMTPSQYITQINGAFTRHQEHRRLDAFQPMDEKGLKYVLDFLRESITSVAQEVQKNTAKSLTR